MLVIMGQNDCLFDVDNYNNGKLAVNIECFLFKGKRELAAR